MPSITRRSPIQSRASEIAEGLGALLIITLILVGGPLLLIHFMGWPLPRHIPTLAALKTAATSKIPPMFWPKAMFTIAWVAWFYFVFCIATSIFDVIAFRRRGTWRHAGGATSMAALISAIILLGTIRAVAPTSTAAPMPAISLVADATSATTGAATTSAEPTLSTPTRDVEVAGTIHEVVRGDCLWELAITYYGDGEKWPLIFNANVGVTQPDGLALQTGHWILPGWNLTIPDTTTAPILIPTPVHTNDTTPGSENPAMTSVLASPTASGTASATATTSATAAPTTTATPTITAPATAEVPRPNAPVTVPTAEIPKTLTAPLPGPVSPPSTALSPADSTPAGSTSATSPSNHDAARDQGGGVDLKLPAIVIGGLGVLSTAVIARSLRKKRRRARISLRPGEMIAASSSSIRDLEMALASLINTPAVDWLDLAMRHLTQTDSLNPGSVPPVRLIRVGEHGVDLILGKAAGVAPGAFQEGEDGWAWSLPATTDLGLLAGTAMCAAWYCALVPVGVDEDGQTYLAPIEPDTVLSVTGPGAHDVVAAMTLTSTSWSWADHVTVTTDPHIAREAVNENLGDRSRQRDRVLYVGSPSDLSVEIVRKIGILSTDGTPATDLAVHCDADGTVEIVPTQLRLLACRLTPEADVSIQEAIETAETPPSMNIPEHQVLIGGTYDREGRNTQPPLFVVAPSPASTNPVTPELELRLLTNPPTINGVADPSVLVKTRARQFELIALLGLSGGLRKEKIRAAIYGTESSVDNITRLASLTRKSLGSDPNGQPYLPEATLDGVQGILSLSPKVTTDLTRMCVAVGEATLAEPREAMSLYESALDLIDNTPGVRIDYPWNWWSHYATLAEKAAVRAATGLATLTIDYDGDLEVARGGIYKARALAPYAEELYCASIELAGAAGNLSWAQREWEALHRMLDDLYPGKGPSPETEAAYQAVMQPSRSIEDDLELSPESLATSVR